MQLKTDKKMPGKKKVLSDTAARRVRARGQRGKRRHVGPLGEVGEGDVEGWSCGTCGGGWQLCINSGGFAWFGHK